MRCRFPILAICLFAFLVVCAPAARAGNKVKVCHVPPGNPANFHTITISANAVPAHLAHGDLAGACAAHCDTLCSDGNPCTVDACDANERCVANHPPVNCDDGNPCTTDSCDPASGCESAPVVCEDPDLCTLNACDPLTGQCAFPPIACPEGQACNSATGECATLDRCAGIDCSDGNACTVDLCDPIFGCFSLQAICEDFNPCTIDSCNPELGCDFRPACPAGQSCNRETGACTPTDLCTGIVCPASPNECLEPVCSGGACSFMNKPDGTPCEGGFCSCLNGVCTACG